MNRSISKARSLNLTNTPQPEAGHGRVRGKKPVVSVTQKGNAKIYKAYQEREYTGPDLSLDKESIDLVPTTSDLSDYPVFLGPKGDLFDINYNVVHNPKCTGDPVLESVAFKGKDDIFSNMPQPNQYDNFLNYEQALLDWKLKVENQLGTLRLPQPVGRSFYRPRVFPVERSRSYSSNEYMMDVGAEDLTQEEAKDEKLDEAELLKRLSMPEFINNRGQYLKLIEKRKSVADLDVNKFVFPRDTWDGLLMPAEPDPHYYDSFEDYEAAMKRWAAICAELAVIPPHANQLKDLIPIQVIEKEPETIVERESIKEKEKEVTEERLKSAMVYVPFFTPLEIVPLSPPPSVGVPEKGDEWNSLSKGTKDSLRRLEDLLFKSQYSGLSAETKAIKEFVIDKFKDDADLPILNEPRSDPKLNMLLKCNHQVLPLIHGTFPRPWERSGSATSMLRSKASKAKYIRRLDLTDPMLAACMDSPPRIDGRMIEFRIPECDIESLEWTRMNDPKYMENVKGTLRQIQYSDRNDDLNSWYQASTHKEVYTKYRQKAESILTGVTFDKVTIDHLEQILLTPLHLDKFQDMLNENMKEEDDGIARTYMQAFLNAINPDNFPQLLLIFEKYSSRLTLAKLSLFIAEVLQSARAKSILEKLITSSDLKSLGFIAYAINFFNDVPADIFPFREALHELALMTLGSRSYDALLQSIFACYFIGLISGAISKQPFIFVAINQFMIESRKTMASTVSALLQDQSDFLDSHIWRCIGHRSSSISSLFSFILAQLLSNQDSPQLTSTLRSDSVNILGHLRILSTSRYSHVQFTVGRLLAMLLKEPWFEFVITKFNVNDLLFEDLTAPRLKNGKPPLFSVFALDVVVEALNKATESNLQKMSFLIDETFFHKVFKNVQTSSKALDDSHEVLTYVMALLSRAYYRLGLVTPNLTIKTTGGPKKKGNLALSISPADIKSMINFIAESARGDGELEKTYTTRKNMLTCLRHIIKVPGVFDFIRKEQDFYSKLLVFCREAPHLEFNREAWLTLYQAILYHHGVLEFLKGTLLLQFIECIGTASQPVVMQNGLRWLAKLFTMPTTEAKKQQVGRPMARTDKEAMKTYEKDIKTLASFYVSHTMFIKVHMIYKKLCTRCSGPAFLELAKFYHALCVHGHNSKVYKDTVKKQDYKNGLTHLNSMFNPPEPFEDIGSLRNSTKDKKPSIQKTTSMFSILTGKQ